MKYMNLIFTEINYVPGSGNSIEHRCPPVPAWADVALRSSALLLLSCGSLNATSKKLQR
jgi:hypothetical protein